MNDGRGFRKLFVYAVAFILLLVLIGSGLYYFLYVDKLIPFSFSVLFELALALVLGYLIIALVGREIRIVSVRLLGDRRGNMVLVIFRFVAYIVLALVMLSIVGVSGTALLAGGTFAGIIIGLAGQTVLSNIISGVMIILARPYEVNDRITFFSWQYGLIVPAYPPKFYSQDSLMPGYSGRVLDIGLAYTLLELDDGPKMKIPNSVMISAAVVSHELKERWVRTKYEIPAEIDPAKAVEALISTIKRNQWVSVPDSVTVLINSASSNSFVVSIDALCKGNLEEPPRSSILLDVMSVVKNLNEIQRRNPENSKR